jgi:O-phosphoseryl-tRNA synthetase
MKFDPNEFKKRAKADFERAWLMGSEILTPVTPDRAYPYNTITSGKEHPIFQTIHRLREAYIRLGFDEIINPLIVDESHVYRQFGREAMAVLDRCFYLAGLPRPNIGISSQRIGSIESIIERRLTEKDVEKTREILHQYKKGNMDGDDIVYEISKALNIEDTLAIEILEKVFPEFKELKPDTTTLTLRSHMTAGWFITLEKLHDRLPHPIKLFSIDRCFRREQGEDATRLYTYFSASCVIVHEDVTVEDGKALAEGLLRQFGFEQFRFRPDEKRSKYYIPGTQTEVFAFHPELVGSNTKYQDGWIELATFGIYSPASLASYDIDTPVMNLGLGVERLAMVLFKENDIRELAYPQLFRQVEFTDLELAKMIRVDKLPQTPTGLEIATSIVKTCETYGEEKSPCSFVAFEGEIYGKSIAVEVVEPEENTKLCGPAYLNEVVIHDGNILGIPKSEKWSRYFEEGVPTSIQYMSGFAYRAAAEIERAVAEGKEEIEIRVRMVESLGDINVSIDRAALNYITSTGKKIDVRGPLFITVRASIS